MHPVDLRCLILVAVLTDTTSIDPHIWDPQSVRKINDIFHRLRSAELVKCAVGLDRGG
jgi:hypothetical protein